MGVRGNPEFLRWHPEGRWRMKFSSGRRNKHKRKHRPKIHVSKAQPMYSGVDGFQTGGLNPLLQEPCFYYERRGKAPCYRPQVLKESPWASTLLTLRALQNTGQDSIEAREPKPPIFLLTPTAQISHGWFHRASAPSVPPASDLPLLLGHDIIHLAVTMQNNVVWNCLKPLPLFTIFGFPIIPKIETYGGW
jgi:hypothetical protein